MIDLEIPAVRIPDPLPFLPADSLGPAGIYGRISAQDSPATASLKTQVQAGIDRAMADRHPVASEHIFFERQSGFHTEHLRPQLLKIKELVLHGVLKALYVYSTDRLARSDDLKFIVRWLERRGCRVIFITFDRPQGHVGEFMLDTMAFVHTHEVLRIRDATDRGRSDLRELGVLLGCGPCRYGYQWDKAGRRRVMHPEHGPIVQMIFDLIGNRGWSTVRVAQYLNDSEVPSPYMSRENRRNKHRVTKWSPTRVGYIIRERTYLGMSLEGRTETVKGDDGERVRIMQGDKLRTVRRPIEPAKYREAPNSPTDRIIDDDLFARAGVMLSEKTWKSARARNDRDLWLLRGLLYCSACGYAMSPHKVATRGSKPRAYYQCSTNRTRFRHDRAECTARLARRADLEEGVWAKMETLIRNPDLVRREIKRACEDGQADQIESEIRDITRDLGRARRTVKEDEEAYMSAKNPRLRQLAEERFSVAEKAVTELLGRQETLTSRLRPYREIQSTVSAILDLVSGYAEAMADPAWLTPRRKREILEAFGVTVRAFNGTFKLSWRPPVKGDAGVGVSIPLDYNRDNKTNDRRLSLEFGPSSLAMT